MPLEYTRYSDWYFEGRFRYAVAWRWAKTVCKGPCKIKRKHVRGYKDCDKNPDPCTFGFEKLTGG